MEVKIFEDGLTAILTKINGRKSRYEIIKSGDIFKVYVSRKRNNSKWSEKFLLKTSTVPIKIIEDDALPMKLDFQPY